MPIPTPKIKFSPISLSEQQKLALPSVLVMVFLSLILALEGIFSERASIYSQLLLAAGFLGMIYALVSFILLIRKLEKLSFLPWLIAFCNSIFISTLIIFEPRLQTGLVYIFLTLILIAMPVFLGRWPTYLFALICFIVERINHLPNSSITFIDNLVATLPIPAIAVVAVETIGQLKWLSGQRVDRLQVLNMVARSVTSSLETMALDADTYYVGLLDEKSRLHLELLYDDGEFYPPTDLPLENTLAGWVIHNRKSLFLANLPEDMPKYGIKRFVVGKPRGSLSWMGTVMQAGGRLIGLVAVASYEKNAFTHEDLELLENLAQQAAMAIDNAYHHADVELKSQLDSLTGAYNHRALISYLEKEIEDARLFNTPLSIIMLDVDLFKKYNDRYGHLVGDQVLSRLTEIIRSHIRESDHVGRWGGEEFSIVLPIATLEQAQVIACRIQHSLGEMQFIDRDGNLIPAPTVSQGIATFPVDADETFKLIDSADQRLYVAKNRGRDEIEPRPL
jgi:diguanylate cyclase (GGDEF)-like protein